MNERSLASVGLLRFCRPILGEHLLSAEDVRFHGSELGFGLLDLSLDKLLVKAWRKVGELEELDIDEVDLIERLIGLELPSGAIVESLVESFEDQCFVEPSPTDQPLARKSCGALSCPKFTASRDRRWV